MRKLASVQRVVAVDPIEGADRIEKVQVLGWQLVSKRGEFKPGDLCVYFELDSIPPDSPAFSFLWATPDRLERPDNFRLRSKRMRGIISQGLALPLVVLPEGIEASEGDDVTAILGVTKWEQINSSAREIAGKFPTHLFRKTDEMRIQSVPNILEELRGVECYAAVKLDGQSLTFARYMDGDEEVNSVCTRNFAIKDLDDSPHWQMARKLSIFENIPVGFVVQGEFVGEGIQGNRLGIKGKAFFAFQVFDITRQHFLDYEDFVKFCTDRNIPTVPIEWVRPLDLNLESCLTAAEGKYASGHPREGIVIRPTKECYSLVISQYTGSANERSSFKAISNSFLLKIGE